MITIEYYRRTFRLVDEDGTILGAYFDRGRAEKKAAEITTQRELQRRANDPAYAASDTPEPEQDTLI